MKGGVIMKSLTRWDPFNVMKSWDPFDELRVMQRGMDRLFDSFFGRMGRDIKPLERITAWTPSIESYMKEGHLVFKAELPGVDPKDLDVSIVDRELVIENVKPEDEGRGLSLQGDQLWLIERHSASRRRQDRRPEGEIHQRDS
jgi:HSP20 family protein